MTIRKILILLFFPVSLQAQVKSGPWIGNIGLRTASLWMEPLAGTDSVVVRYFPLGKKENSRSVSVIIIPGNEFNPSRIDLTGLEPATEYRFEADLHSSKRRFSYNGSFTTKELWQYRKPAPDIVFLAGSCSYFNEPEYDRPGKPYGGDSTIFLAMAKEKADFNLWLGDSWYYREVDFTPWGMYYRASLDRSRPVLQPLLKKMPQYFLWDDHDYGPNNAGMDYIYKNESRKVFMDYTLNPSYGQSGEGVYTRISESDVDLFLLDGRWFRSHQSSRDSAGKTFLGKVQMQWLKNSLLDSRATFKVIVSGSQVLNPVSSQDCMRHYETEFNELMDFLESQRIQGVIFLSGDRHHSEIMKRDGLYTYYDITVSPLTSGVSSARPEDTDNPARVGPQIKQHNYARVSVYGPAGKRKMKFEFLDVKGNLIHSWEVSQEALKAGR